MIFFLLFNPFVYILGMNITIEILHLKFVNSFIEFENKKK